MLEYFVDEILRERCPKKKCQCHPEKAAIENLKVGENVTGRCGLIWVSFF